MWCSATLPRSTLAAANLVHVHTEGKWAGCAEGQIRDIGDHDRDGIPNSRDLCGQTTLYTLVSASVKLAGCSVAQNANVKTELDSSKLSPSAQEGDGTTDAKSSDPVSSL